MSSFSPFNTALALLVAASAVSATSITFHNTSPSPICYKVEFTSGTLPTQNGITCDSSPGLMVQGGQTITVNPSPDFNGALTAMVGDHNDVKGGRYEMNFAAQAGSCWYDVDYQLGMSDGTLGPSSHQSLVNGQHSLAGEQDTLAKANAAWPSTPNKAALLAYPDYLKQGRDGKLSHVYINARAPQVVIGFFQLQAEFTAYVDAGSVAGNGNEASVAKAANFMSWVVESVDMDIVAY